jgi:signal peptidase
MPDSRFTSQEEIDAMRQSIARAKDKRVSGQASAGAIFLKLMGWILFTLIIAVLVLSLVSIQIAKSRGETPSLGGFYLFRVTTGSMDPTLPVGSVILARKPQDPAALSKGDIVSFRTASQVLVTHRIIEVVEEEGQVSYRTQGDNPINDPDTEPLFPENVVATFILKVPLT